MRDLAFSFILLFFYIGFSINVYSQQSNVLKQDWSALFPEIPNCEREVQPVSRNGKTFVQTAVYMPEGYDKAKKENYFRCGSITLRVEPSAKESAGKKNTFIGFPTTEKFQIQTFEAYRESSLCGNDVSIGSVEVFFDKDKVLKVEANGAYHQILEFAQNADYKLLKKSINKFLKSKSNQK